MARTSMKNVCRLISQAEKELPIEVGFLNELKRSIEFDDEQARREPSRTYKPSGMNCIRQSYYQIVGVREDPQHSSYTGVGICNSGTDIHERIQKAVAGMKKNGFDCEYVDVESFIKERKAQLSHLEIKERKEMELKLYHKVLNMSFMCDGIIKYKNHYYILELKTETANKWFTRQGVDKHHYNQAIAYSMAFELNEVIFVYISRDTLDMKSYLFTVDDRMRQELLGYIEECDSYIAKKQCPPRYNVMHNEVDKKTCDYCHYKEQCRKDGHG